MSLIQLSVGKPTKCSNIESDVYMVQRLLRGAASRLSDKDYDPGEPDGVVGSKTLGAIREFQDRFMNWPDVVISPNGRTIRELSEFSVWALLRQMNLFPFGHDEPAPAARGTLGPPDPETRKGSGKANEIARTNPGGCFPIPQMPTRDITTGARYFGAPRTKDGRYRKHAGVDLICKVGTPVFAVADGVVKTPIRHFYRSTGEFAIDHGDFWVRYCEIAIKASKALGLDEPGTEVKKGQLIGFIGIMKSSSMLHFEMYSGEESGTLALHAHRKPYTKKLKDASFMRRRDLINPTDCLKQWMGNIPELTPELAAMAKDAASSAKKARDAYFAKKK